MSENCTAFREAKLNPIGTNLPAAERTFCSARGDTIVSGCSCSPFESPRDRRGLALCGGGTGGLLWLLLLFVGLASEEGGGGS